MLYKSDKFTLLLSIIFILVFIRIKNKIKNKGINISNGFINKSIKEKKNKNKYLKNELIFTKDVLFINGCDPKKLPHPYRYRVLHQMEQLEAGFLECDQIFYLKIQPNIVRYYRIIIIFRCPWTKKIGEAIKFAKSLNKIIIFKYSIKKTKKII